MFRVKDLTAVLRNCKSIPDAEEHIWIEIYDASGAEVDYNQPQDWFNKVVHHIEFHHSDDPETVFTILVYIIDEDGDPDFRRQPIKYIDFISCIDLTKTKVFVREVGKDTTVAEECDNIPVYDLYVDFVDGIPNVRIEVSRDLMIVHTPII